MGLLSMGDLGVDPVAIRTGIDTAQMTIREYMKQQAQKPYFPKVRYSGQWAGESDEEFFQRMRKEQAREAKRRKKKVKGGAPPPDDRPLRFVSANCMRCGAALSPRSKFCTSCGAKVRDIPLSFQGLGAEGDPGASMPPALPPPPPPKAPTFAERILEMRRRDLSKKVAERRASLLARIPPPPPAPPPPPEPEGVPWGTVVGVALLAGAVGAWAKRRRRGSRRDR